MWPTKRRWTLAAIPRSRARSTSIPGVPYPVHDTTVNRPTSDATVPELASAAETASLPSGRASCAKRAMRAPVDQRLTSSTRGSTTPCRVATPEEDHTRRAVRLPS